jgi:hypothetical protein
MTGPTALADLTLLDRELTAACQMTGHRTGGLGCDPTEDATQIAVAPCCGPRNAVCASRARYVQTVATVVHCSRCDLDHPSTAWRFEPIGDPA